MPRFILELAPSNGFYKSLVDNPRDRMTELAPVMQQAGLTWEQRYYVVGENKFRHCQWGFGCCSSPFVGRNVEPWVRVRHMPSNNNLR